MKNIFLTFFLSFTFLLSGAQKLHPSGLPEGDASQAVSNQKLFSSEDASSFLLVIRADVKRHKHESHSEHVVVLSGKAKMQLGEESFTIEKGDVVFIPRNTAHSVTLISKKLKVISIQAPEFDGKDRVMLE